MLFILECSVSPPFYCTNPYCFCDTEIVEVCSETINATGTCVDPGSIDNSPGSVRLDTTCSQLRESMYTLHDFKQN